MHSECGVPAGGIRDLNRRDGRSVMAKVSRTGPDPGSALLDRRAKADPLQLANAVRRQEHARADLAEAGGLLVDRHLQSRAQSARSLRTTRRFRRRRPRRFSRFSLIMSSLQRTAVIGRVSALYLHTDGSSVAIAKRRTTEHSEDVGCADIRPSPIFVGRTIGLALCSRRHSMASRAGARRWLSRPHRENHRAVPGRWNGRPAAEGGRGLAVAQMGPAGRSSRTARCCRKHRRRTGLSRSPDGYTLLSSPPPPLVINQNLYPKLGFDPPSSSRSS